MRKSIIKKQNKCQKIPNTLFDKVIGKMIKITSNEWEGELTKDKEYVIVNNVHGIPSVVNDIGILSTDILCFENDWEFS